MPHSLVEAHHIDQLAHLLEECVHSGTETEQFRTRLLRTFPLQAEEDEAEVDIAVALYKQLLDLEQQGVNGIWARIIKNAFAPRFQGRFDYVAGNPPWVNWESLPRDYREDTSPLWLKHKLFSHTGYDAILGGAKDDISVLLTYVATDSYLKDDGKLGFVITQSVFKTGGGGQGFRRFELAEGTAIKVIAVDDMVEIKPFEGASNRTAVFVFQRGQKTKYPVPYNLWRKAVSGKRISEDSTLEEALAMCKVRQFVAQPVNDTDLTSSWITGKRQALQAVKKVLGSSEYVGRAGVCTWLNGVYWMEVVSERPDGLLVVSNLSEGGRTQVETVQAAIEPDLLFPLLRGRGVNRWQAIPSAHILVTHQRGMRLNAIPEREMAVQMPKTFAYLKRFEAQLRQRLGFRRYFRGDSPFYSIFNVGDYTFAPYKVVWKEQASRLTVAVASSDSHCIVPDHKSMLVPFDDEHAAHYLCAALNSSPAQFVTLSYAVNIQMDTHILENVRVPKYDNTDQIHLQLANYSQQAHAATTAGDTARVEEIEAEIDQLSKQLWGLTSAELREIQESLAELC